MDEGLLDGEMAMCRFLNLIVSDPDVCKVIACRIAWLGSSGSSRVCARYRTAFVLGADHDRFV